MKIGNTSAVKAKKSSNETETNKDEYTSHNSLAGRTEVKSVSKSMHDYITDGFAKLAPPSKKF